MLVWNKGRNGKTNTTSSHCSLETKKLTSENNPDESSLELTTIRLQGGGERGGRKLIRALKYQEELIHYLCNRIRLRHSMSLEDYVVPNT